MSLVVQHYAVTNGQGNLEGKRLKELEAGSHWAKEVRKSAQDAYAF